MKLNFKLLMLPVLAVFLCGAGSFSFTETCMDNNKVAKVKFVSFENEMPDMAEINAKFTEMESHPVDVVNWPERNNGYNPKASFKIMYSEKYLYIRYEVAEKEIRAAFDDDSIAMPWTDDCMELFIIPESSNGIYYNIEMNCVGCGIVGMGATSKDRVRLTVEQRKRIRRFSTLGREAFGERVSKEGDIEWYMIIAVPWDLLTDKGVECVKGKRVRANVYKCGDKMFSPHYLTWNPIGTPAPRYHTPEFFGYMDFE